MIHVPHTSPQAVSFTQVSKGDKTVVKAQILKSSMEESAARAELDNANHYLAKATEMLASAELAYRESIQKSGWNKDELKKAHAEAMSRFRYADEKAKKAAEAHTLAKSVVEGLYKSAGIVEKREFSDAKRKELTAQGKAMPGGKFPIETVGDLKNALNDCHRLGDPTDVKSHITAQAKALGATDALPNTWRS